MTIEQRAKQAYSIEDGVEGSFFAQDDIERMQDLQLAYINGATEQKAIDDEEYRKDMRYLATKREELIDKACREVEEILYNAKRLGIHSVNHLVANFRKAMEE